ncbi:MULTISPECIES: SIR2 family protein [unclassified Amycolatopsis]|uniref:SIR2 family protein n=1 Tax=unclassified Amycolatopsis TaxID=2618356 RepID=UPI002E0D5B3C|nr:MULTISPECIES: SIR2 family protein [unclassified Amycolatopsis]WSK78021.1 SIR2 family protein [Amycolatopsis sp. NBC_01286]
MPERFRSKIVDASAFDKGDTFSFETQPYLTELFEAVRDRTRPLTIVVGAGVSMNSSLPSWPSLIAKMTEAIDDEDIRTIALADRSDLMRKAEIVLQLIKDANRNIQDHEVIRDALYQRDLRVTPGLLAQSIARLAYTRRTDCRLLTTNFDIILEEALLAYFAEADVKAFSIRPGGKKEWAAWNKKAGHIGVLHLHGLVRQARNPEEPIILTESQFLKYGAEVRAILTDSIKDSCTIFIGLSMSDPNLVGPLYGSAPTNSLRFSLVVPPAVKNVSTTRAAAYAINSARYLEQTLGLKPIFLKSYSQLNQAISDLALAVVEPERYRPENEVEDSLVYNRRFAKALDDCYTAVGCEPDAEIPAGQAAEDLTTKLHDALSIPGGPLDVLEKLSLEYDDHVLGGNAGENFGLFLWLRSRLQENGRRRYTINLVGTSVYTHREEWSLRHHVTIDRGSDFAAAQAVFTGNLQAANLSPSPIAQIWRGILAAPILVSGTGSEKMIGPDAADILSVGAITLNSTYVIKANGEEVPPEHLSLISKLDSERYNHLLVSLQRAAEHAMDLG